MMQSGGTIKLFCPAGEIVPFPASVRKYLTIQSALEIVEVRAEGFNWIEAKEGMVVRERMINPEIRSPVEQTVSLGMDVDLDLTASVIGTIAIDTSSIANIRDININAAAQTAIQNAFVSALEGVTGKAALVAVLRDPAVLADLTTAIGNGIDAQEPIQTQAAP